MKVIFLDRDGVINKDPGGWTPYSYVTSPDEFKLIPGAVKAIRRLKEEGYAIYVISNQGKAVSQKWRYYVDAHTGKLLYRYNNIKYGGPTGAGSHQEVSGNCLEGEDGAVVTMTGWKETGGNY